MDPKKSGCWRRGLAPRDRPRQQFQTNGQALTINPPSTYKPPGVSWIWFAWSAEGVGFVVGVLKGQGIVGLNLNHNKHDVWRNLTFFFHDGWEYKYCFQSVCVNFVSTKPSPRHARFSLPGGGVRRPSFG